jgi:hypothetical protein
MVGFRQVSYVITLSFKTRMQFFEQRASTLDSTLAGHSTCGGLQGGEQGNPCSCAASKTSGRVQVW